MKKLSKAEKSSINSDIEDALCGLSRAVGELVSGEDRMRSRLRFNLDIAREFLERAQSILKNKS